MTKKRSQPSPIPLLVQVRGSGGEALSRPDYLSAASLVRDVSSPSIGPLALWHEPHWKHEALFLSLALSIALEGQGMQEKDNAVGEPLLAVIHESHLDHREFREAKTFERKGCLGGVLSLLSHGENARKTVSGNYYTATINGNDACAYHPTSQESPSLYYWAVIGQPTQATWNLLKHIDWVADYSATLKAPHPLLVRLILRIQGWAIGALFDEVERRSPRSAGTSRHP